MAKRTSRKMSQETKDKISKAQKERLKNKPHSEEANEKRRAAMKAYWDSIPEEEPDTKE